MHQSQVLVSAYGCAPPEIYAFVDTCNGLKAPTKTTGLAKTGVPEQEKGPEDEKKQAPYKKQGQGKTRHKSSTKQSSTAPNTESTNKYSSTGPPEEGISTQRATEVHEEQHLAPSFSSPLNGLGTSKKRRRSVVEQALTPPDSDSQDRRGVARKKQKVQNEQNATPPDSEPHNKEFSWKKRRRSVEEQDGRSRNTSVGPDHESNQKRQKLAHEQSLTSLDTESLGRDKEVSKSELKTIVNKRRLKSNARVVDEDVLIFARVDIILVFSAHTAEDPSPVDPDFKYEKGVSVQLKHFNQLPDGSFFGRIKCLERETLFEFEGTSKCPQSALEILRQVIKAAANQKANPLASNCWFSRVPRPAKSGSEEEWRLRCQILARPANRLTDRLPTKPKPSPFDIYAFGEPLSTFDSWTPKDFYDNIYVPAKDEGLTDESLQSSLQQVKCQLYPFQKRAVKWLLKREGAGVASKKEHDPKPPNCDQALPHGFSRTPDVDGKEWLVSRCLGLATKDESLIQDYASQIKGGILAEEMGLGKTVEMIALMCLHRREISTARQDANLYGESLTPSAATLIITPPAILRQWESELQTLAPHLKVMIYEGVRTARKGGVENDPLVKHIAEHDVILTTYNVLGREVHYTTGTVPIRDLRYEKIYERKKSPLTQIMWWRVVLDEAQMVESGVSNAAKVAQIIPRENAWAVSGTPVKKESQDLLGLLIFLRFEPYSHSVKLWNRMINHHREIFRQIFRSIALRHTKDQVRDELQLPTQTRVVINVPFTPIEEQHYSKMFQDMCKACGLDLNGWPLEADWNPNSPTVIAKMREWLTRLRQDCLHPEVGIQNKRALGASKAPLRTVDEVLDVMTEQNETNRHTEERALLLARLRRGQVLEHTNQSHEALRIWREVLAEVRLVVGTDREQLRLEMVQLGLPDELDVQDGDGTAENPVTSRLGAYRQRLRGALEIEHMSTFFIANAYFQIKSDISQTEPESNTFKELDKAEEENYELAKGLRQEMLSESQRKADAQMNKIQAMASKKDFVEVPRIKQIERQGGIESRDILDSIHDLISAVNNQGCQLSEWRQKLLELVLLPLVDKDDSELQGDEYETSTKQQDELYVYMDALRAIVSDRNDFLTGQTNRRIDDEMKTAIRLAQAGEGHSPELMQKLLHIRENLKPSPQKGSIRGVITKLRERKTTLRAQLDQGSIRAGTELMIINYTFETLQVVSNEQTKILQNLDRELELFKSTVDGRLEYYRQLQHISDQVVPYEQDLDEDALAKTMRNMEQTELRSGERLATLNARARYLVHLRTEATSQETQRQCIICREQFERGVLTSCGHSYCVECARLWWTSHRNCPTCKKTLSKNDFHQITYKPRELTVQEETATTGKAVIADASQESIYSGISSATLSQIKNLDLPGSFGTKIDTIARHILWIREKDPGAKTVIFSQYKDFMQVLGKAFRRFKIAFASIDVMNGVNDFKSDPSIECFFLHAKAQASGLNLVNATHLVLCEPLMNTAIELQVIARVHRIGQHQPTTVWMYLVEDTVEKSIYDISVKRRMSHMGHAPSEGGNSATKQELSENQLDAANTLELQRATLGKVLRKGVDELVDQEDLWDCLFRQRPQQIQQMAASAARLVD